MATIAERLFRLLSLSFLTIGFLVGIAGADKSGEPSVLGSAETLVREMHAAEEVNRLNEGQFQQPYIVGGTEAQASDAPKHGLSEKRN